jgi:predicted XRE-type DNA-binding protein
MSNATKKRASTARDHIEYRDVSLGEFLGLSQAEEELIEMKYQLTKALEELRKSAGVTQSELARKMGTKQPAVARMINSAEKVSLDTILTGFFALGKNRRDVARLIAASGR